MNAAQRQRQIRACHIAFKNRQQAGHISDGISVYAYAAAMLRKREVHSLKELTDAEVNAFRDVLSGKEIKQYRALDAAADAAGIRNICAWISSLAGTRGFASWLPRGSDYSTLSIYQAWRLTQMLITRAPARR